MRFVLSTGFGVSVVAIAASLWIHDEPQLSATRHVVVGRSMVPTLYPASSEVRCDRCQIRFFAPIDVDSVPESHRICFHCGDPIDKVGKRAADVVEIVGFDHRESIVRGQLVACRDDNGKVFVKRVIGIPGDQIEMADDRFGLLVNGNEPTELFDSQSDVPRFRVDVDNAREKSRWISADSNWHRDEDRTWHGDVGTWLVYHSENVYGDDSLGVVDDYPYNIDHARKLYTATQLELEYSGSESDVAELMIAYWTPSGDRLESTGDQAIRDLAAAGSLDRTHPVAIASAVPVNILDLVLYRKIQYRLRVEDERQVYPIVLPTDHYYVLGDNVPISVDSRSYGAITREQIVGLVQPVR